MDYLKALLDTYEACEQEDLIDKHENSLYILPIYHTSLAAKNDNIVKVVLDINGNIKTANFVSEGEIIVFPIEEDSITRSGKNPPAHPLVDKFKYINLADKSDINEIYINRLENWLEYSRKHERLEILEAIYKFVKKEKIFKAIVNKIFSEDSVEFHENYEFTYYSRDEKGKEKSRKYKFNDIFITFELDKDDEIIDITHNNELHQAYIDYINEKNQSKDQSYCSVSNKKMYCNDKHRGIFGNAKLISVSNNKETYYGRFKEASDVFTIGYETSQKIHLMLKALLENQNSYTFLTDTQHMVVWSSDDVSNEEEIKIDQPSRNRRITFKEGKYIPSSEKGKKIGESITKGLLPIDLKAKFYILIVDKLNPGRVAIKYFRELPKSELLKRLERWVQNNSWDRYNHNKEEWEYRAPNIYEIINVAYGIERNGQLTVQSDKFRKNLIQEMIQSIVDGKAIPADILLSIRSNIVNRQKYKKTWNQVYYTALSVLRNYLNVEGGVEEVMDKVKDSRSFLFGRLLAVYHSIENSNYSQDSENIRSTNAEKYWSAFITNPEITMLTIDNSVKPYSERLKRDKPSLYYYYDKKLQEIMKEIENNNYFTKELNQQLDFRFLYGYYYQIQLNYQKKEEEEDVNKQ